MNDAPTLQDQLDSLTRTVEAITGRMAAEAALTAALLSALAKTDPSLARLVREHLRTSAAQYRADIPEMLPHALEAFDANNDAHQRLMTALT